ncbi:MAG TPA: sulfatase-like hydrolase/transferase, partial [Gemmataceae bacterium]|nr:sulfatase-like hydrolase/transferase [Gemmataceae bacterium]
MSSRPVVAAALVAALASPALADSRKPNLIVFLSDDVGYGEYGFQGNTEIPTPNIDAIARNGVRFTQGYVSGPYCSPTRAGLMTGRYQTRFGHEFNAGGPMGTQGGFGLPVEEKTIADRLKALG